MENKLHGKFFRDVEYVSDERTWQWLRGGFLDKRTEGFMCAAQVLRTMCYSATVMKKLDRRQDVQFVWNYAATIRKVLSALIII